MSPTLRNDGPDHFDEDLLALAAHDGVDPGRFAQHLLEHEGRVDAAEQRHDVRVRLLGDLEGALGLVDRRRDGGRPDNIRLFLGDPRGERLVAKVVRHRVDEADVRVTGGLQRASQISNPGRRPVACDLGAAGVIIRVNEENAQRGLRPSTRQQEM